MKKGLTTLLVILLAVGAMLVSCKAEVGTPADELVSVSFEMGSSRALSATIQSFDPGQYYWKYAAKKNTADTSGLTSGSTATYNEAGALPVSAGNKGLKNSDDKPYKVPDFSQGIWDFMLFAYKTNDNGEYKDLVYQGEATAATLVKNGKNTVHVVVSPASEGNGTLVVGTTTLTPHTSVDTPTVSRFLKVENLSGTEYAPTEGTTYTLPADAYKVTVTYKTGDIIYAEGTVIATVYPGLTTTVAGSVDELVTYAQFEAERNPDIIFRTAEVEGIKKSDTVTEYGLEDTSSETAKVSATIPAAAAKALIESTDPSATMSLALNVDTVDSTSTSVTYEIGMTKTITVDGSMPETTDVTFLNDYVTATVQLSDKLTGVKVKHGDDYMVESDDTEDDEGAGIFSYNATTGVLTIVTKTFSPFEVSYDEFAEVAQIGSKKYATLAAAVAAAVDGDTVTLIKDAKENGFTLNGKDITLVINGKTLTTGDMWVEGHATLTVDGTAEGSLVLGRFCLGYGKDNDGNIDINGGEYRRSGTCLHINGNCHNSDVTIRNAKITSLSDNGIQLNGSGKFLLENCEITGATAVYVKSGELTINGGKYTGNMTPANYSYYGNGANATGDAIVIDSCEYPGGAPTVIINDGIFSGTKGALGYYLYDGNKDGSFESAAITVNGGTFNEVENPVAIVKNSTGNTAYATLQSALDAAVDGDTVVLLKDVSVSSFQTIADKDIVLDGNSHSLISAQPYSAEQPALYVTGTKSITLKDITIIGEYDAVDFKLIGGDARCSINLINSTFEGRFKSLHFYDCKNADIVFTNSDTRGVYGYNVNGGSNLTWTATGTTFGGWNSAANVFQQDSFEFTGCEYIKAYGYSACKPYGSTTYNQCKFGYAYRDGKGGNGLATGVDKAISLNFNGCLVEKEDGTYEALNVEILQQMLNYEITSGSSSGPSTINKQYWYIDGLCVLEPTVTEQVE